MAIGAAELLSVWSPGASEASQRRLARVLALATPPEVLERDTLGGRNRRILALHRDLSDRPLEAKVACACGTDNEFVVPVAAILSAPMPPPGAEVRFGGSGVRFRLPVMRDLEPAAPPSGEARGSFRPEEHARAIARLCCLEESLPDLGPAELAELAAAFEALDPAAEIAVALTCAGCGGQMTARVDPALFVARELDQLALAALREIDRIARAYGWSEAEILALSPERRRTYCALIAGGPVAVGTQLRRPARGGLAR